MNRAFRSIILVAFALAPLAKPVMCAAGTSSAQDKSVAKTKAAVKKLGTGTDARIKVTLRDKRTLSGYISAINDDSFVVTDPGTGTASTVAYGDVDRLSGKNLSTGAKIAIGVGIAVAALAILVIIGLTHGD